MSQNTTAMQRGAGGETTGATDMTTRQPEALIPDEKTVMAQAQVYASTWAIVGSRFDAGDGLELAEQEKTILADMVRRLGARITELESQLAQRFDAADVATASAQGFRDGVASVSAGSEPVAVVGSDFTLYWAGTGPIAPIVEKHGIKVGSPLYSHTSPKEGMAGWISVKDCLPQKNTEVLICFAELSIPSTGRYTASALDHEGWCYPQENHLWPGERPDFEDGGSPTVTHWMPLPAAPGPADGESNELC